MVPEQLRRTMATLLCCGLTVLAVCCSDGKRPDENQVEDTPSTNKYGGAYRKSLRQEPFTLDPALITDIFAASIVQQLFDGLVQFDADLNVVPSIAKSWSASHDGMTWTFHLREGVKFHNSREVTAEDFVYSFTRILDPKTKSPRTWLFERVQGAKEFLAGEAERVQGLQAPDNHTLQIQ